MRWLNGLFGLAFVLSVAVQYNDPDPLQWMAEYGAAASACVAWDRRALRRWFPALVGLLGLAWAAWIFVHFHLGVPLSTALTDWGMHSAGSEESREIGGLLLVVGWMAVLTWRPTRP